MTALGDAGSLCGVNALRGNTICDAGYIRFLVAVPVMGWRLVYDSGELCWKVQNWLSHAACHFSAIDEKMAPTQ